MPEVATTQPSSAWYRSPVLWLALALPLLTVVAGIFTIRIAASGLSDVAPEDVTRVAQVQTADLVADEQASRLALSALGQVDPQTLQIRIRFNQDIAAPALHLRLIHPVQAAQDQIIALQPESPTVWTGRMSAPSRSKFRASLLPDDGSWRLVSPFDGQATSFNLQPAWSARRE